MPTTTFIEWKHHYSVGSDELDADHRRIVAIINDLHNSIRDQSPEATLQSTLVRLFDYTQTHFTREERVMQEHQYPDLPKHRAAHSRLTQRTRELLTRCLHEESDTGVEAMTFLKDWWIDHILVMDSQYKPYILGEPIKSQT